MKKGGLKASATLHATYKIPFLTPFKKKGVIKNHS